MKSLGSIHSSTIARVFDKVAATGMVNSFGSVRYARVKRSIVNMLDRHELEVGPLVLRCEVDNAASTEYMAHRMFCDEQR
jgi:hypothetical protein